MTTTVGRADRKTITALGGMASMTRFPVAEWEQTGRGRFAKWRPLAWRVPADQIPAGLKVMSAEEADDAMEARKTAGRKAASAAKRKLDAVAASLGLPPGSRTAEWLARGEISRAEAERIAGVVTRRHENTDYDALLAAGVDRDTAREIAEETR